MTGVLYAGVGIAAATALGSGLGLAVNRLPAGLFEWLCSLAAGIMIYAAVAGLILPAADMCGGLPAGVGVLIGALFLACMNSRVERLMPQEQAIGEGRRSVLLVTAIVVHHFPEGMAAGMSFATGDPTGIAAVCAGIALQNIPEAMMILPAMTRVGVTGRLTALVVLCSAGVEILGLCLGYGGVQLAVGIAPILPAFAGGTMLLAVTESMLPDSEAGAFGVLAGFCGMMLL